MNLNEAINDDRLDEGVINPFTKVPEKNPKEMIKWIDQDLEFYDKAFSELLDYVKRYTN